MVSRVLRVAFGLAATGVLSILLLTPDPLALLGFPRDATRAQVSTIIPDWLQHAISYAVLTGCLCLALGGRDRRTVTRAALLALAHGAATELLQTFVPDRICDFKDFAANVTGVAIASVTIVASRTCGRSLICWRNDPLPEVAP